MATKEDLIEKYFKDKFPHKKYLKVLVHKDFGGYFRVLYTDEDMLKEDSVDISYLDFITWLFNNHIAPDKFYVNLN